MALGDLKPSAGQPGYLAELNYAPAWHRQMRLAGCVRLFERGERVHYFVPNDTSEMFASAHSVSRALDCARFEARLCSR